MLAAWRRAPGWAPVACALLMWGVADMLPGAAAAQSLLIIRPLDNAAAVFYEDDPSLLIVPGGRMYRFRVEITAFSPLLEVRINGTRERTPRKTWAVLEKVLLLRFGENRIRVDARSQTEEASKEFVIELKPLPGFGRKRK